MSLKPSQALLAALALIAGPAFAQDATAPATPDSPAAAETPAPDAPAADAPAIDSPVGGTPESPVGGTPESPAGGTPEAPAADAPAAAEAPADASADAPADAPATPAPDAGAQAAPAVDPEGPGTYYAKSEHGDWTIRCIRAGQGKDPCEMYKLLTDEDDNAVAELTMVPLSNGNVAAGATLVAPLETDLIEGLGFQVDSGELRGYPFSFCAPVGCVSRLGFTTEELNGMKRGGRATVQLLPFGGDPAQPVQLSMSLSGFTAAFDELTAYAAAPEPAPAETGAEDAAGAEAEAAPAE